MGKWGDEEMGQRTLIRYCATTLLRYYANTLIRFSEATMQAYGKGFAQIYNLRWGSFAETLAPLIRAFYEETETGRANRMLLDVCCGAGHLARHFLEHGYHVLGVDLSAAMLRHARENTAAYVEQGLAQFIQADAASFALEPRFGLAVSTFDALNHLPDLKALQGCFRSAFGALAPGGWFVFDLNTRAGLQRWSGMSVSDTPELLLITRGVLAEVDARAYTQITAFVRREDGLWERVDETAYNTIFDLSAVEAALREVGFASIHFARSQALAAPLPEPEAEPRVFIVAQRSKAEG